MAGCRWMGWRSASKARREYVNSASAATPALRCPHTYQGKKRHHRHRPEQSVTSQRPFFVSKPGKNGIFYSIWRGSCSQLLILSSLVATHYRRGTTASESVRLG